MFKKGKLNFGISIHALAKRATNFSAFTLPSPVISIHALAKRATFSGIRTNTKNDYFNPRPRKEGDTVVSVVINRLVNISIHALAKRATWPLP